MVLQTAIPEVLLIEPEVFQDNRGFFFENFRQSWFDDLSFPDKWLQENCSFSHQNVIRGLHFQWPNPQAKLISVSQGEILDVAVDIRRDSPSYLQYVTEILSHQNHRSLYIPVGFAHGFAVLSEGAIVNYKCANYYEKEFERTIRWNDPQIGINWPVEEPILSQKDSMASNLKDFEIEHLPIITT